jgi:2-phosphoglycerate kinase
LDPHARVILLGGSSHAGKSTLAQHLAQRPGWACTSTDSLARHPGRPWRPQPSSVPPHVAEHYLSLTGDELIASVLGHYRNVWPLAAELVLRHAGDETATRLVLEGSALWPECVVTLRLRAVSAVWLTADDDVFATRIRRESRHDEADPRGKQLIDKFIDRTLRFNRAMMEQVSRLGLAHVVVEDAITIEALADECVSRMRPLAGI